MVAVQCILITKHGSNYNSNTFAVITNYTLWHNNDLMLNPNTLPSYLYSIV